MGKEKKYYTVKEVDKMVGFTKAELGEVEKKARYLEMLMDLREAREEMALSQEELAVRAGVPRATVSKIESGLRNATMKTLMNLAQGLNRKLEIRFV